MKSRSPKTKRNVAQAARRYITKGYKVIPARPRKKIPKLEGWQNLRIDANEVEEYFDKSDNIGILWGKPSDGLVDVDIDCEEAVILARDFLPSTDRTFGRRSRGITHYCYVTNPVAATTKFNDINGDSLVEIRSNRHQTIVPPSIHPDGERIRWYSTGTPTELTGEELYQHVSKLAATTMLVRHWPQKGSRHEASLALCGMLARNGWKKDAIKKCLISICKAAGDEEWRSRQHDIDTTLKRMQKGKEVTGAPTLAKLIGEKTVERVCEWLGVKVSPSKKKSGSQSADIATLVGDAELFHTSDLKTFVTLKFGDHEETWSLKQNQFINWLRSQYFKQTRKYASTQAVTDAVAVLEGQALFEGPERRVHLRLAELDHAVYLDLANAAWEVVRIDRNGWDILKQSPVKFRRTRSVQALPTPARNGSLLAFRHLINISDDDWPLISSWLVGNFRPVGPYPVLVLQGEQGSAKTSTARLLKAVVDPSKAPLRSIPKEIRDLMRIPGDVNNRSGMM